MRIVAVVFLAIFFPVCAAAAETPAQSGPGSQAQLRTMFERLDSEPALAEFFPACPADYFAKAATVFDALGNREGSPEAGCADNPSACLNECIQGKNSQTCFNLARAIQAHADPAAPIQVEKLFAFSCATGKAAACTNRGGGMRNGRYEGDPSLGWSEEKLQGCLRRTFALSCGKDDSWGCAMHGQSLFLGEGGPDDWAGATEAFEKSCALGPEYDSCGFAKSYMADMKALSGPQ